MTYCSIHKLRLLNKSINNEEKETFKIGTELNDSVFGDKDGEYSLAYNDLIAPLVKAVQELSAKITALENA